MMVRLINRFVPGAYEEWVSFSPALKIFTATLFDVAGFLVLLYLLMVFFR